ncbi:MAG: hypothetical protein DCC67_13525 [Planctomycetota bacterium]|nr:MAG: hypothetical protein DCC67_13525 [Planctomycetota bacterium]
MEHAGPRSNRRDFAAATFALLLPSLITWLYFYRAAGASPAVQLAVFNVVKVLQFAFPLVWALAVERQRLAWRPPHGRGVAFGLAFGAAVGAATLGLYYGFLQDRKLLAAASGEISAKVQGWGLQYVWQYVALGVFYSLLHALLEEYYWRWFVFGRLRRGLAADAEHLAGRGAAPGRASEAGVRLGAAIALSSLGFMAHHVLVLGKYFGFGSPATWFFSGCVAAGGAVWAWLYHRTGSLLGPWLSHLLVDAAIFWVGYDLLRGVLR